MNINQSSISVFTISIYLLLSNLGSSIAEVANDAIVAEAGKQPTSSKNNSRASSSVELQAFVWVASSAGGILGNLLGGIAIDRLSSQTMFLLFSLLLSLQFLLSICVCESSLNLPKSSTNAGISVSAIALVFIVSGYHGVALASYVGITTNKFSGLSLGLQIQAVCTILPLSCSWCIPDDVKAKTKRKDKKKKQ